MTVTAKWTELFSHRAAGTPIETVALIPVERPEKNAHHSRAEGTSGSLDPDEPG